MAINAITDEAHIPLVMEAQKQLGNSYREKIVALAMQGKSSYF
jgi:hypothetical protein